MGKGRLFCRLFSFLIGIYLVKGQCSTSHCKTCATVSGTETCSECIANYYLVNSNFCTRCSKGCKNTTDGSALCNPISGDCTTRECYTGFVGQKCDRCDTNYYNAGGNCYKCSDFCLNSCDGFTGDCFGGCRDGYWGRRCLSTCSPTCKGQLCSATNGYCLNGCNRNSYGNECENVCGNCECDRTSGSCVSSCTVGYFGQQCTKQCNSFCFLDTCEQIDGNCTYPCPTGYYGQFCSKNCSSSCGEDKCERSDGRCSNDCKNGYFGDFCEKPCPRNCKTGSCDKGTGECNGDCVDGYTGSKCTNLCSSNCQGTERTSTDSKNNLPLIVGVSCGGGLLIIFIVVCVVCTHTFRSKKRLEKQLAIQQFEQQNGWTFDDERILPSQYEKMSSYNGSLHDVKYQGYDNILANGGDISVEQLNQYVARMLATKGAFEREHKKLPVGLVSTHTAALAETNIKKNRYKNIYAYDHSRVILEPLEDKPEDDGYINANYIHVIKCIQYWPTDDNDHIYGDIRIKFVRIEEYADFNITFLTLSKGGGSFDVNHLQFTSWPDKDVPRYVTPLVEFLQKVQILQDESPIIVHCSAGIGRTGTFMAVHYLYDEAQESKKVNVFECVKVMRQQRVNLVHTVDQYRFIHECLLESITSADTAVTIENFRTYFAYMMKYIGGSQLKQLESQFIKLKSSKCKETAEAANLAENIHKNRTDIVANDSCRVFLWSSIRGCNDYINAIYIPNYRKRYAYVVTEMPKVDTIIDFCRLIQQEECRTIVMLNNDISESKQYIRYWGDKGLSIGCGPFKLVVTDTTETEHFICRTIDFTYNTGEAKGKTEIKQFQIKSWPEQRPTPSSVDSILDIIHHVGTWQQETGSHPIIVHCMNGADRSGLYCLASAAVDRVNSDHDVAFPHLLNHMRARRKQLVPYFVQYKFCHEVIDKYIDLAHED